MTHETSLLVSRRALLAGAAAFASNALPSALLAASPSDCEPFWGEHQGGITTPQQKHCYFAALDLQASRGREVVALLRAWTNAAARMTAGEPGQPTNEEFKPVAAASTPKVDGYEEDDAPDEGIIPGDTGEVVGIGPARLTVTFGFGAGLFVKDGTDRYGLARRRPAAFADLPVFVGDQLMPAITGGDLSVQACADDPQVAFHAVRQLVRIAEGVAAVRWVQTGFLPDTPKGQTPRNLMGFRDGTRNPDPGDPKAMNDHVWVGSEGPEWMRGGSYMVNRRIRIALERWDRMKLGFQEQTVGRTKEGGAPLGAPFELSPLPLTAKDKDGNPLIAEHAHVRLAAPETNGGAAIYRRGYSYNDGVSYIAERWPPWHQGLKFDAGLIFISYQKDPRTSFIPMFDKVSKFDMMNQFVTHIGGGFFACPPGVQPGEFIGQRLFEAA